MTDIADPRFAGVRGLNRVRFLSRSSSLSPHGLRTLSFPSARSAREKIPASAVGARHGELSPGHSRGRGGGWEAMARLMKMADNHIRLESSPRSDPLSQADLRAETSGRERKRERERGRERRGWRRSRAPEDGLRRSSILHPGHFSSFHPSPPSSPLIYPHSAFSRPCTRTLSSPLSRVSLTQSLI